MYMFNCKVFIPSVTPPTPTVRGRDTSMWTLTSPDGSKVERFSVELVQQAREEWTPVDNMQEWGEGTRPEIWMGSELVANSSTANSATIGLGTQHPNGLYHSLSAQSQREYFS